MSDEQDRLPLRAADGSELPPPPKEEWREHTAERWQRDDPEGYAECIASIKRGEMNKSRLAARFKRSRNTVLALMVKEFSVEQLREINGKLAAIVTSEALTKQDELIEQAGVKELGSVSISGKAAFDIAQVSSGGPTEIRETRHTMSVDDFNAWLAAGDSERDVTPSEIDSLAGKVSALPPPRRELALPALLGGKSPLPNQDQIIDIQDVASKLILVFIPFLELLSGLSMRGGGG